MQFNVLEKDRYQIVLINDYDTVRIHIGCYADEDFEDKYFLDFWEELAGWGEKYTSSPKEQLYFKTEKEAIEYATKFVKENL